MEPLQEPGFLVEWLVGLWILEVHSGLLPWPPLLAVDGCQ